MTQNLTNEQKFLVSIAPQRRKKGVLVPAEIQPGSVLATVQTGDVTIEPYTIPVGEEGEGTVDEKKFWVVSGTLGPFAVLIEADADLGDGIKKIQDQVDGVVTTPEAEQLGISAAAPVDKEEAEA